MICWDENRWETEYDLLMGHARSHLDPAWTQGQVVVLKTAKENIYTVEIPDFIDPSSREPLENQCIQLLQAQDDTRVLTCLATMNGEQPEILSWNFRSRLVELNAENLQTYAFLWGGGENILVKPFQSLLPPEKK